MRCRYIIKYSIVGLINTVISYCIMMIGYNIFHLGYWMSTAAYAIGTVFSFWANKNFTFWNKEKIGNVLWRYLLNIIICYVVVYGLANPAVEYMVGQAGKNISGYATDQISMLLGMVLYTVLNYCGQRKIFVKDKEHF